MRKPKYLSYSSLTKYEEEPDEWCIRYVVDNRPPREPQWQPAGVGSAFDARVKAVMYEYSYGANYKPEQFSYEALFEKQVEQHNRDFCGPAGDYVFACYELSGFLDRLKALADRAVEPPQYEFRIEREVGGVPLLGLPDGHFILPIEDSQRETLDVIADFKVNGFCSRSSVSPNQGYILCMDGYSADKQSRSHGTTHAKAEVKDYKGIQIGGWMEDFSEQWANQLSGYGWCLGAEVGDENVVTLIHQCVAKPMKVGRPLLRFAEFAGPVRKPYQDFLLQRYQKCWNAIETGHIFQDLTRDESDEQFNIINSQATKTVTGEHDLLVDLTRPIWRGK
jgi:hypothetical protein